MSRATTVTVGTIGLAICFVIVTVANLVAVAGP